MSLASANMFCCAVVAGAILATQASAPEKIASSTAQSVAAVSFLDCVETRNAQPEAQSARGDKLGEGSMGFTVATYECKPTSSSTTPAMVRDLPWASGGGGDEEVDSPGGPSSIPIPLNSQECQWYALPSSPAGDDPRWEGNDPTTGLIIANDCNGPTVYQFMPGPALGQGAIPPPPTPQELAEQAYREIAIPVPKVSAGPDRTKLAVNLWTWLWVDNPGPQTVTVTAGGISVTATANLDSVQWSVGEPPPTGGAYASGAPTTVTFQGAGTPPPPNYDWKAEPPCGHKYTWMSTKERTGGTGKWPITATSNWDVTWQSNTGVTGSATLSATGNDALEIGEYRIVLVQGAGG